MAETTIDEVVEEAKAAAPASINVGGWVLTYVGEWDVSKIVEELGL